MSAAELVPLIQALPRNEKFQLLQFLVSAIAKDENIPLLDPTVTYPMWTPYNTPPETATVLTDFSAQQSGSTDEQIAELADDINQSAWQRIKSNFLDGIE